MARSIVSQSEQFGLPVREAAQATPEEIAEIMRPRGLITSGLLNTNDTGYDEAEY